jgi:large subunit ribosomal protein L25
METVELKARARHLAGTDVARKIRRAGLVPGVVYGAGFDASVSVALEPRDLTRKLTGSWGRNQLFELEIAGREGTTLAFTRDLQLHPVRRTIQHIDLMSVAPDSKIRVRVPIKVVGRSKGQQSGGRLQMLHRDLPVECTPATLPKAIECDITTMENGDQRMIDALPYPEGVRPLFRKAYKVLEVVAPKRVVKTAEELAADAAAEAAPAAE